MLLQSCLTLCDPVDYSLPDSSVQGILLARILEWIAIPFSRGSSRPKDRTCISYMWFHVEEVQTQTKLIVVRIVADSVGGYWLRRSMKEQDGCWEWSVSGCGWWVHKWWPVRGHQAVHVRCTFLLSMELYLTKRIKTPVALSSPPKTRLDTVKRKSVNWNLWKIYRICRRKAKNSKIADTKKHRD